MTSCNLTPRVFEAVSESASVAVIKTASKHLHNDLARAIEALEQKKLPRCAVCPYTAAMFECR